MKFSISQDLLSAALGKVVRAVSSRSTLPVLANVLLQVTGDGWLRLAATDLEIGIACRVECQHGPERSEGVDKPGAITVPARTLADLVAALPRNTLEFTLHKNNLELVCGASKASLRGIPAGEFPPPVELDGAAAWRIPAAGLKPLIQRAVFAASDDESRPALNGVLLVIEGQKLTLAAADGFRLSESRLELENPAGQALNCIVPSHALAELARVVGDAPEVEILYVPSRGQIAFRTGDCQVVSQLIEGSYPDYRQIIPRRYTARLVADTAAMLKACKQAEIFARENGKAACLAIYPNRVEIRGQSAESGSTGATVEAAVEGLDPEGSSALEIAFNVAFLREALSAVRTPTLAMEVSDASSPGVFRPVGEDGFLHLIMPLHLGN